MGSTFEKENAKRRIYSMGRKAVSVALALCLVAGLNPAAALATQPSAQAGDGASQTENSYAQNAATVSGTSSASGGQGSSVATDVRVAVTSDFEVLIDNTEAVVVDDAVKLESGAYVLEATLSSGQPMRDSAAGTSYYEYKWTRQVFAEDPAGGVGSWQSDDEYNQASAWQRANVADAQSGTTKVSLNLRDVRDTLDFSGQAHYLYTIIGKDLAIERTSSNSVEVVCSAEYEDAIVHAPANSAANADIYVRGLLHVGDPQLFVNTLGPASTTYGMFLQAANGMALDGAYDLSITEQQAANAGKPAYLQPLTYIQIPLSDNIPVGATVEVFGIATSGDSKGMLHKFDNWELLEIDNVRYVQISSGSTSENANAALVCGAFAVAYQPSEDKPSVNVVSRVEGEGGLIDIMGSHVFAQGTTVRYTFLPSEGFCLDKVVVVEGDPDSPTASKTYIAGKPANGFGANWLDYVVSPSNPSNPEDVTITAYFTPADIEEIDPAERFTVEASVGSGEGAVKIDGGKELSDGSMWILAKPGSAVTVQFIPGETSVLDYVEVTTGTGSSAVIERPSVVNSALTLPAVTADTKVVAHFKYGTPVIYPDASISYAQTTNGAFGDGNPTSAVYGASVAVQVVPESDYTTSAVWFTFDDDEQATKYPLRYSGAGTSWIIDYVLGNITVHASFTKASSAAMQVKVVAGAGGKVEATYTNAEGVQASVDVATLSNGVIANVGASSDLRLSVSPDPGKLQEVSIVAKDGSKSIVGQTGSSGSYLISNAALTAETFDHIEVVFRDSTTETLSVGISIPEFGVKVFRTDVAGVGEITPDTSVLSNISPADGLNLRVELLEGYKNLVVELYGEDGSLVQRLEVGSDGALHVDPQLLNANRTIKITCERESELPPHGDISVEASTDGNGTISTTDKTVFAAGEELSSITYAITAKEGYELDYVAVSGSADGVDVRTFSPTVANGGWSFTLNAAMIENGYDRVKAVFKPVTVVPGNSYWVTPVVVNEEGLPVSGADAHGKVSPSEKFQVSAGGVATLSFVPDSGYRVEVAVGSVNGPWSKAERLSYSIGMDGGLNADTTVYVRFVQDSSAEEREMHTIQASVFGGVGGSISPAGSVEVAHRASAAFSFIPDTNNGYELSYVVVDAGTSAEAVYLAAALAASNGQYIFNNVTEDHTIVAVFAKSSALDDVVQWTVSAGENGSVSPSGNVLTLVSQGGREIDIAPNEGYVIDKAWLNGEEIALTPENGFSGTSFGGTFWLLAEKNGSSSTGNTFYVTFAPRPVQAAVHVKVNGSGGKVSPAEDSVAIVGTQQTVTFVPDEGYKLSYARYTNSAGMPLSNGDFTQAAIDAGYSYTFTIHGETWIECAFEPLEPNEEDPIEGKKPITITAVSVGDGAISPYGSLKLYPDVPGSKVTFTLVPNAGAKLVKLTVGGRDVTADVQGSSYTLLASNAHDGDEVRAVFEKVQPTRGKVELTSGSGGAISPAGTVEVPVGTSLPISFIPASGMMVESVQLIFANEDGTTRTQTVPWVANSYTVASVAADLIEVHVTFKKAEGSVPSLRTASVKAVVAPGSEGLGSVSPAAGTVVEVAQGSSAMFTFLPEAGCVVKSAKLGSNGKNLVQKGATRLYVSYGQLLALGGGSSVVQLEVEFEKLEANPDYVNIIVDVTTNVNGRAQGGIEVGAGGVVSPQNIRVPYGSNEAYAFYVFPDDGYKLESITASVDGGAEVQLDYTSKDKLGSVNDIGAIASGDTTRAVREADGAGSGAGVDAGAGSARYYMFQLENITGNVDVQVSFVSIADGEEDDAINGEGKRVQLTVESSEGGFVSPSGNVTLPEGCTYPFLIEPESSLWEPVAVVISYADGTKHIIEDVNAGRFPIKITADMTGINVVFEQVGTPVETVRVKAEATGPGSVSPSGTFDAKKGEPQAFTFKFDSKYSYIESLVVTKADGTSQDLVADGWVWKFDPTFYIYDMDSDVEVAVRFATGTEENPMWEAMDYVKVSAQATTEGKVSAGNQVAGGTISPAGDMWLVAGMGSQLFQFKANRGYIVDSVIVTEGSGANSKVTVLSAEEIAAGEFLVANVMADTTITANFIPTYYLVDVSSGEGGSFDIEGKGIKVRQGQRLALYAQPEGGYELDSISTNGLVVHDDVAKAAGAGAGEDSAGAGAGAAAADAGTDGQVTRVATLGGRATNTGEWHTFAVAGSGSVYGTFKSTSGQNPVDPNNPSNPNNPGNSNNPNTPAQNCTVKVSSSGHGEVSPSGEMSIAKGSTLTLTLKPAIGYYPASVTVIDASGKRNVDNAARTFSMVVQDNCELVVNFSAIAAPGSSNAANRTIRTLQSLAKTGDNALVGVLTLTCVACAAVGFMLVTRPRRRGSDRPKARHAS